MTDRLKSAISAHLGNVINIVTAMVACVVFIAVMKANLDSTREDLKTMKGDIKEVAKGNSEIAMKVAEQGGKMDMLLKALPLRITSSASPTPIKYYP